MEINDLRLEKYIKVANLNQLARPELLSTLCISDKKEYFRNIHSFEGTLPLMQSLMTTPIDTSST